MFGETFRQFGELLQQDVVLVVRGAVRRRGNDEDSYLALVADEILDMRTAREVWARRLLVEVPAEPALPERLRQVLQPYRGGKCAVALRVRHPAGAGLVWLGDDWKVTPDEALLEDLRGHFGLQCAALQY